MSNQPRISVAEARTPLYAGIDVGGQTIKAGLVDDLGRTLAYGAMATEDHRGCEDAVHRMCGLLDRLLRGAGLQRGDLAAVGLATPGPMDIPNGIVISPFNLPGWRNFPIRDRLSEVFGRPVAYENDANAAAFGEYWIGTGLNFDSIVLFTLGTGVGCGIIIGDLVVSGAHSHGGECGHIIIDYHDDSRICPCGQAGHLEAYASATGVMKRMEEFVRSGRPTSLRDRAARGDALTPLLLAEEALRGDLLSRELILETARFVAVGAVTLMHTVDPGAVIIGGAMTFGGNDTELGREFLAAIRAEVRRRAFPILAEKTVIDYAMLGGDAGYVGAAGVARVRCRARS